MCSGIYQVLSITFSSIELFKKFNIAFKYEGYCVELNYLEKQLHESNDREKETKNNMVYSAKPYDRVICVRKNMFCIFEPLGRKCFKYLRKTLKK